MQDASERASCRNRPHPEFGEFGGMFSLLYSFARSLDYFAGSQSELSATSAQVLRVLLQPRNALASPIGLFAAMLSVQSFGFSGRPSANRISSLAVYTAPAPEEYWPPALGGTPWIACVMSVCV